VTWWTLRNYSALSNFKASLDAEGLLGAYDNPQDLANQIVTAIDYDVSVKQWGKSPCLAKPKTSAH
jgi:hypothetical protein